jgi:hypothetical protein
MSWLARAGARLLPAARRDWAEALWAEAHEVPAGWRRLAWRAGGAWLMVREARMARRTSVLLLFAAAAWIAWPRSPVPLSHGAANDGDIIITVTLLAGLPLLGHRLLGPPASRAARWLRTGFYAAVLAIMMARGVIDLFVGAVPRGGIDLHSYYLITQGSPVPGSASGGPDWGGEISLLLITACYLAVITALTARRAGVTPAALATGACAGLVLGAVMYAVDPVGGAKTPSNPWLHGTAVAPLMVLAWTLLFLAPAAAGALAGRRRPGPGNPGSGSADRSGQSIAAGLVSSGVGALTAAVLGTGTTALMIKSAWMRDWLYHGQHLTASAVYGRELYAGQGAQFYAAICVIFPLIGLLMGAVTAGVANLADLLPSSGPAGPSAPERAPGPISAMPK